MVDAVNSGYKQDLTAITFGTTIATLADGTWSVASDVINQDQSKNLMADFVLTLGTFGTAPTADSVAIYLMPVIDGATDPVWETGSSASPVNESYYIGSFTILSTTAQGEYALRGVALPAGKFKIGIRNTQGYAFVGASLEYRPWNYASQ